MDGTRIQALDVIRGVAVMGILVANLPGFALPEAAYFSPLAWGGRGIADLAVWFATYVLVEGKMRALFSLLFGASILLVADGATRTGASAAQRHYARMATLFAIGCAHLYGLWQGDILAHYALVGAFAFLFRDLPVHRLVVAASLSLAVQFVQGLGATEAAFASALRDTPEAVRQYRLFAAYFGIPPRTAMLGEIHAIGGGWLQGVAWRWHHAAGPVAGLQGAPETLSAMLFGMAGLRSGFLTGGWSRSAYRRWAIIGLGVSLPAYALLARATMAHGFAQSWVIRDSIGLVAPLRMLAAFGYAAAIILLIRRDGRLTRRIAAVGRMALSNYLGTTLMMTAIFSGWGFAQFATWDRAALYWLILPAWAAMLAWSAPWLGRFRHGPFEWAWRSIARCELQPLRGELRT